MDDFHEQSREPLIQGVVDLTIFRRLELPIDIFNTEAFVDLDGDPVAWRCQMLLVAASWRGSPAGSMPGAWSVQAKLAGFGTDIEGWKAVAPKVLHWWVRCSDGRLYFEPLVPVIEDAWERVDKKRAGDTGRKRYGRVKAALRKIGALIDDTEIAARIDPMISTLEQRGYFDLSLRGRAKVSMLTHVASDYGMLPDKQPGVTDARLEFAMHRQPSHVTGADSPGQVQDSPRQVRSVK